LLNYDTSLKLFTAKCQNKRIRNNLTFNLVMLRFFWATCTVPKYCSTRDVPTFPLRNFDIHDLHHDLPYSFSLPTTNFLSDENSPMKHLYSAFIPNVRLFSPHPRSKTLERTIEEVNRAHWAALLTRPHDRISGPGCTIR
jgi:hypothetical protein